MAYNNYGNNGYNKGGYNNNGGYNKGGYNNQNGGYNKQQGGSNNGKGNNNKVGAIWRGTTKTGNEFLSITIGDKKYVAFVNTYKNAPNQPDFNIMESTVSNQGNAQNGQAGGYNNGGQNSGYNNQQGGGYKPAGNGNYGAAQNGYGKPNQAVEQNNVDAYYEAQNMPIGRGEFPKNEFDNSVADISDLPGNDMPVF